MRLLPVEPTCALALLLAVASAAADPRFDVIEPLPGSSGSEPLGVTKDGCVVVGRSGTEAFRWRDGVSSPLRADPAENPAVAHAITPDGKVVVGETKGRQAFRLEDSFSLGYPFLTLGSTPGDHGYYSARAARAVAADGFAIVGTLDDDHLHSGPYAFHFWPFRSRPLEYLPPPFLGEALAISADNAVIGGWQRDSATGSHEALLWRWSPYVTSQPLSPLQGHTDSEVRGLSADGGVAVGRSSFSSGWSPRAVRWTASGVAGLGAQTRVAHAVSADGSLVVGDGTFDLYDTPAAFVWDALHGARPLADVLHDAYGLDLGGFQLLSATAVSPDGLTFVGHGVDAQGTPKGWRARLADEVCMPDLAPENLLEVYGSTPPLDQLANLAVDSAGRVHVTGSASRNLVRIDPANPTDPAEVLLDFDLNPPPGPPNPYDAPSVLGIGPDDAVYIGTSTNRQLLRRTPAGALEVVVDGSAWPPLNGMDTRPQSLAIGADGTLFLAADARLLRIDPDGSLHELLDARTAGELASGTTGYGDDLPLAFVALGSEGRVFLPNWYGYFVVAPGRATSFVPFPGSLEGRFYRDPSGGFWITGHSIAHVGSDGRLRMLFAAGQIPDGVGGTVEGIGEVAGDEHGNLYYQASTEPWNPLNLVRHSPGGAVRVIGQSSRLDLLALARDGALYLADYDEPDQQWMPCPPSYEWDCLVVNPDPPVITRLALPEGTACTNGVDDDGDGATDYPEDPGCVSATDEGERTILHACDNGVDDDGDGAVDFPADPACVSLASSPEATACDDGLDNDGDGAADWDGAGMGPPDPECGGDPQRVIEHPWYCGLGFEVALVALPLSQLGRRWRRARARQEASACSAA